jgi:hypothetical protein
LRANAEAVLRIIVGEGVVGRGGGGDEEEEEEEKKADMRECKERRFLLMGGLLDEKEKLMNAVLCF